MPSAHPPIVCLNAEILGLQVMLSQMREHTAGLDDSRILDAAFFSKREDGDVDGTPPSNGTGFCLPLQSS